MIAASTSNWRAWVDRLAHLQGFQCGDLVGVGADDVGDAAQVTSAFAGGTLFPVLLRGTGSRDGLVYLCWARALDQGDRLTGGRVLHDELVGVASR